MRQRHRNADAARGVCKRDACPRGRIYHRGHGGHGEKFIKGLSVLCVLCGEQSLFRPPDQMGMSLSGYYVYDVSVDDRGCAVGRPFKGVAVVQGDVGVLAGFYRADARIEAEYPGGVDGDRCQGVSA